MLRVPPCKPPASALISVHPTNEQVNCPEDLAPVDPRLRELLFLDLLARGFYIAPRGYLALSLAVTDTQVGSFVTPYASPAISCGPMAVEGLPRTALWPR